ncbi:DUF1616 domain-containing protein [Halobium palmae]|uniref:DUF1616 domain-containing protein n=1 Tax=Halobium palmae TaxID=1776492 RepID=A0ABD5RV83_9EURY
MAEQSLWWYVLPEPIRELPADLAALVALVGLTIGAVFLPVVNESVVRIALGLPFVLFVPGYAFIAALFPETGSTFERPGVAEWLTESPLERGGIDGIERVALSFGTSIAIVPLLGLVLNFTPWGIRLVPIVITVGGFSLVATAIASQRRRALASEDRFAVPYRSWGKTGREELLRPSTKGDAVLNVVLVASLLLAVGSVGYAVAVPKQGESFSELYLLTENESGALVADDYPTEFTAGDSQSLIVGIGNHEHQRMNYTVVTALQRVSIENNTTRVREQTELHRFQTTLPSNETWQLEHTVTPRLTGERLRLVYLLYRGAPPEDPTVANAYRENHLWVNVTARNASSTARIGPR